MKSIVLALGAVVFLAGIALGEEGGRMYSATGDLGKRHIDMYNNFGAPCTDCHTEPTGSYTNGQMAPLDLSGFPGVTMGRNRPCGSCHRSFFTASLGAYGRCDSCHPITRGSRRSGGRGDDD